MTLHNNTTAEGQEQALSSPHPPTEGVVGDAGSDKGAENDSPAVTIPYGSSRERRLRDAPRKYQAMYRKAWRGTSRKSAIRAHCLECVGYSEEEVRLCTAPACPLFEFRLGG